MPQLVVSRCCGGVDVFIDLGICWLNSLLPLAAIATAPYLSTLVTSSSVYSFSSLSVLASCVPSLSCVLNCPCVTCYSNMAVGSLCTKYGWKSSAPYRLMWPSTTPRIDVLVHLCVNTSPLGIFSGASAVLRLWSITDPYHTWPNMYRLFKLGFFCRNQSSCGVRPVPLCGIWFYLPFASANAHGQYVHSIFAVVSAARMAFIIVPL